VRSLHQPDPADGPAPLLGERTEQIARERLGLTRCDLDAFIAAGVLQPSPSAATH
jgi:hypothetical protein